MSTSEHQMISCAAAHLTFGLSPGLAHPSFVGHIGLAVFLYEMVCEPTCKRRRNTEGRLTRMKTVKNHAQASATAACAPAAQKHDQTILMIREGVSEVPHR